MQPSSIPLMEEVADLHEMAKMYEIYKANAIQISDYFCLGGRKGGMGGGLVEVCIKFFSIEDIILHPIIIGILKISQNVEKKI